ncbi:response regulator transcription factor [Nocardia sp. NPDC052566]|uniref:response regulator transcription factor n=1 Tax=Nocardia sp. NPDC052566 TaxID=3364330 RepID=UPI0037C540D0
MISHEYTSFERETTTQQLSEFPPTADGSEHPWLLLSKREQEVLALVSRGLTYAAVARSLRISVHTVDTYLRRIRRKTSISSMAELAIVAYTGSSKS